MRSWRDYQPTAAKVPERSEVANGANGANGTGPLPASVAMGLRSLARMGAPRSVDPQAWAESVKDAQWLGTSGWAARALALGWTTWDVWGAGSPVDGNPDEDGLAVRLRGRKLLAISADVAIAADPHGGRSYLYRGVAEGSRLLWEIGR